MSPQKPMPQMGAANRPPLMTAPWQPGRAAANLARVAGQTRLPGRRRAGAHAIKAG